MLVYWKWKIKYKIRCPLFPWATNPQFKSLLEFSLNALTPEMKTSNPTNANNNRKHLVCRSTVLFYPGNRESPTCPASTDSWRFLYSFRQRVLFWRRAQPNCTVSQAEPLCRRNTLLLDFCTCLWNVSFNLSLLPSSFRGWTYTYGIAQHAWAFHL